MFDLTHWLNWAPWLLVPAGMFGLASWAFGLPSILKIVADVSSVLAPIARAAVEAVIAVVKWLWITVLWPGLKDIFDSWATIATVLALAFLVWGYVDVQMKVLLHQRDKEAAACVVEVKKLRQTAAALQRQLRGQEPPPFRWPWE